MYDQEIHSINHNLKHELILDHNETNSKISNSYAVANRKVVPGPAVKINVKYKFKKSSK